MKQALENKGKARASGETGKEQKNSPSPETTNQKRGRQEGNVMRDTGQEGMERPGKKRKSFEAPESEVRKPETSGAGPSTGASTPVAVKIKRMEKMSKVDQGPGGNKIQPTLRSFMDLKCGLVGARNRAGGQNPVKQARAGRDPSIVSPGDSSLLVGEATKEGKESEAGGSSEKEEAARSKESRFETQGQGVTMSGSRPRQGKVVASRREAYEGKDVCGGTRTRGGSKR